MRERAILGLSLALNVGLLTGWYFTSRHADRAPDVVETDSTALDGGTTRTSVVVRRQYFSWQEVESSDYPTYIANLRAIGCPEQTIRDIIVADVNQLFARRRAQEIAGSEQQWWLSDPDPEVTAAARDRLAELEQERRDLLIQLLGPDWDQSTLAIATAQRRASTELGGPVLGKLSPEKQAAVLSISEESRRRAQDYLRARLDAGEEVDPAELARLRQEMRQELAEVLDPLELEEYLLRYSRTSETLREQLRGFQVTAEEFRRIFRAHDRLDSQIDQFFSGDTPSDEEQRRRLAEQKEQALRTALGNERYAEYQLLSDPDFQVAQTNAERYGAPPESVLPLYYVGQAIEAEKMTVRMDPTLSEEQRIERLKEIEADHEKSLLGILGEQGYQRYRNDRLSNAVPPLPPEESTPRP